MLNHTCACYFEPQVNLRQILKRLAAADLGMTSPHPKVPFAKGTTETDHTIIHDVPLANPPMVLRVGGSAADTAAIYPEANQSITLGEDYWDELVLFHGVILTTHVHMPSDSTLDEIMSQVCHKVPRCGASRSTTCV